MKRYVILFYIGFFIIGIIGCEKKDPNLCETYPQITFYTDKIKGDSIELFIDVEDKNRDSVWIDLNNDNVRALDGSEDVNIRNYHWYSMGSSNKITIYGRVTDFFCSYNKIRSLDVSGNSNLKQLRCYSNDINIYEMGKILNDLPVRDKEDNARVLIYSLPIYENNEIPSNEILNHAKNKNWTIFINEGSDWLYWDGKNWIIDNR